MTQTQYRILQKALQRSRQAAKIQAECAALFRECDRVISKCLARRKAK